MDISRIVSFDQEVKIFFTFQTGYLGHVDQRSHHGGCDLLEGQKWIANSWISGTTYRDRFKPGVFYTP